MIVIQNTIVSESLLDVCFVCDLKKCMGACCVEGDAGAPLEETELKKLQTVYDEVKPYMIPECIEAVDKKGLWVVDEEGDYLTPLYEGKYCVYTFFDHNNIAKCAIEKAFIEGKINFKKPISCHLYPVRITDYSTFDAVNYHRWPICSSACENGKKLNVRVFQFLKEPLLRKYGEEWYQALEYEFNANVKK
jgi:hypothetical protein